MRRLLTIAAICAISACGLALAVYGQSKEDMDNLEKSKAYIQLLDKVVKAVETIEKDREPAERVKKLEFIDVSDLMQKIPDFEGPDIRVFDPEAGGGWYPGGGAITFNGKHEPFEGVLGPEELIELIKASTGEEKWPEEEGGFGTIEHHRGKLLVCNTPEIIREVKKLIESIRKNAPVIISSAVYLLAVDEDYLKQHRRKGSSIITPEAIKKMLNDSNAGEKVSLLRTGYMTAYSSQAVYLYNGAVHVYMADTDTSGAGGLTPVCIFDPIIRTLREGLVVALRAQYNRHTSLVNLVASVTLGKLTAIEEHTGIGGGVGEEPRKCKVETPKVDLQIVSGSSDIPAGYGLLLGGSRMKTAQAEQKSFIVLIVPTVQK